ncbi:MAG: hypothetical protein JXA21_29710 [Anaerolineae bacterium]|nr:hypothetical protein [Anaerolineae bacterium]
MGLLGRKDMESPHQQHIIQLANDVMWIEGELETMGNPHNYINQDGLSFLRINQPHIAPWAFTGLPASHVPLFVVARDRIQILIMSGESAQEQFRPPMKTETLVINLSLAVIRGKVPFLSEAQVHNFLDFWKGVFVPVMDAELYFLAEGPGEKPTTASVLYIHRNAIQCYLEG